MSPRHKSFDPSAALNDAVELFWTHGYQITSVEDLVNRMGINRFSLYDTFGDKHELFMSACHRYREYLEEEWIEALEQSKTGLVSIRLFFKSVEKLYAGGKARRGCLITNSVIEMAIHDEDVRKWSGECLKRMEGAFLAALTRAKAADEINADVNLREQAVLLVCLLQGINVLGKAFPDRSDVGRLVRTALAQIG